MILKIDFTFGLADVDIPNFPGANLRWGNPPNLGLAPKYDMKHCLTSSKHLHIGGKGTFCSLYYTPKCVCSRG